MKNLSLTFCLVIAALLGSVGSGFASDLPPCPSSGYKNNCFGTYNWSNGDKYFGEFKEGNFNGQGTFTSADGDKYVGEFKDDKRNGQGTYSYAGGDKYVGEYKDGKRTGQGTYYFSSGDKYVGEFVDDKQHGQGTYTFGPNSKWAGDKYVGEYKDDKKHGHGTYYFVSGNKFVGEFRDDKINGQGIKTYVNGTVEEGTWKDNEFQYAQKLSPPVPVAKTPTQDDEIISASSGSGFASDLPDCPSSGYFHNCFGTMNFDGGGKYVGEWKDGKSNGTGTETWANGEKYFGKFKNDKTNGQGIRTYANGDKYVGEEKNGKKHGNGTYTFASGSKDVGEFKDGKLNGYATRYSSDGSILKEGIWKDDEFQYAKKLSPPVPVAKTPTQDDEIISASDFPDCPNDENVRWHNCFGTYTYASGDKYVGEFKDDEFNGKGTYTFADGEKYVGEFKDNKQHGQGTTTFSLPHRSAGQKHIGEYSDGEYHGQGIYTWEVGDKYVGEFNDNASNGQGIYTFANGTVKEGIWKDWEFQYAKKLSPPVPVAKTPTQDDEIISASSGSGFAVSSDGYVITNHHVIEGCQKIVVHTKEKDLTVRVITYDPQNDLALLKGDFRPSTVFPLSSNRPELLQDIYVAGYPFGNKVSTSVKVTKGIISSLTGIGNNFSNIQIDAALQSGNSGGPILDDLGNVVGVAVSKLDAKYMFDNFGSIPENTNFGIKSIIVRSVLDSNEVDSPPANQSEISKSKLGKMISSGTYYISCWMTMAQIEKMKTKKVFFSNLD